MKPSRKPKPPACRCDGWWFPHRLGCAGCKHEDRITRSLREAGMIITPLGRPKKIPF